MQKLASPESAWLDVPARLPSDLNLNQSIQCDGSTLSQSGSKGTD
jgi:hypothetical protein